MLWRGFSIATICLTHGRGSQRGNNLSPNGYYQKKCFHLPHCSTILLEIFHAVASQTELLYAYQIRNVHCSCMKIPSILSGLEIIQYTQYFVAGWQLFLLLLYIAEMSYIFLLLICFAIPFVPFLDVSLCDTTVVKHAKSLTLTDSPFVILFFLWLPKHVWL